MNKNLLLATLTTAVIGSVSAETCTWTGSWNPAAPQDGDAVVIESGDLTWVSPLPLTVASWTQGAGYTGTVTFDTGLDELEVTGNVTLEGGTWTHTANPSFTDSQEGWTSGRGTKQLIVKCGGNFTLGAGAKIDVNSKGFPKGKGPGFGKQGLGASHGGNGCYQSGKCYGSILSPVTIGSGGRDFAGGGAVRLTVTGTLTVNGPISADGVTTSGDYHGAGGSVYLTAGTMTGSGNITAIYGRRSGNTTVGGGGRIALKLTGSGDFSGLSGQIATGDGYSAGGAGTVYYETAAQAGGHGKLVLDNGGTYTENVGVGADVFPVAGDVYNFSEIVIRNGGRLTIHSGATVNAATITGHSYTYSYLEMKGGTLNLPANFTFTNIRIRNRDTASRILTGTNGDLILGSGAYLYTSTVATELTVPGDLTVRNGAQVRPDANGNAADKGYGVRVNVLGNMTVEAGGIVHADECGFNGSGNGTAPGYADSGCHGGYAYGGDATMAYGSVKYPDTLGTDSKKSPRNAGGRVRVKVAGTLTVNGRITANGGFYNGGSAYTAAGGSIWIDAGTLAGSGFIFARGGSSTYNNTDASGSGGRVAVYLTQDNATFDAFYGAGGEIAAPGGIQYSGSGHDVRERKPIGPCGTVYLSRTENSVTNDVLVIRNRNSAIRNYGATIGPNVTDTEVGSVLFETNGVLSVAQDGLLKVKKDFTRDPLMKDAFTSVAGDADHTAGTVEFVDSSIVSTVTGTNDFARLLIATPDKTVKFGTAAENTLTEVGVLQVTGAENHNVSLQSTATGSQWPLMVYGSAEVDYATVKDSNAAVEGGLLISAKDSTDAGNNDGWRFASIVVGETITWTGSADSSWSNVSNWDKEREPVDTDVVVIDENAVNMPSLVAAVTLNSLRIKNGATLSLEGYYLTVTNNFSVEGALVCSASEVITASGPVMSFDGGSFTCANSTFVLAGGINQLFDPAALVFNVVRFDKNGGTATLADGFKAYQLYVSSETPVQYAFAATKTVEMTDFYVSCVGAGNTTAVTLASTTSGSSWKLKVGRASRVQGVIVSDSDASLSASVISGNVPSTDSGNNVNWRFGTNVREWIGGTSGGSFTNGTNWAGGEPPDAMSLVYLTEDAKMSVPAPVTIREMVVAGGTADFTRGTNLLTVTESLTVEDGAVLSMTSPLSVGENVILRSGATLTHDLIRETNTSFTNQLHLTVGRDLTVEAGATIDVSEKGFGRNNEGGLGKCNSDVPSGPSHGGIGGAGKLAYDNFYAPIHPGSSAHSGDTGNVAGGAVRLIVDGTLMLNGSVKANSGSGNWYVSSPGSIWITAGDLAGTGSITANAGSYLISSSNAVGGGRVSVCLTTGEGTDWSGTMSARGASAGSSGPSGTVYFEKASEGPLGGTLTFDGRNDSSSPNSSRVTPIPCGGWDVATDYANVSFVTINRAVIKFSEPMKIRDLVATAASASCTPKFYTDDNVITVLSHDHNNGLGWTVGSSRLDYRSTIDAGSNGKGDIIWHPVGTKIFIR